jgi:gluconate kinase
MIIHLNGWPGVGKRTIGEALSRKLGARFIHNHLLHDVAIACAGLHGARRWELYEEVRAAAYSMLAQHPISEIFVMTNALCNDTPREELAWKQVVSLAITRGVPLVPVVIEASASENVRRVQSPDRIGKKLGDATALTQMMDKHSIQRPDIEELIMIDVTNLSAQQAAEAIFERLDQIRSKLQPATLGHLRMLK